MDRIDEVLEFWFGGLESDSPIPVERISFWFRENEGPDRTLREESESDWSVAAAGDL